MRNKKIISCLLSFFIPCFLFLLVMYLRIGKIDGNYILITDMEAQYNSLFQYLKNVFNGNESLFYSLHKGVGGEMFTTFTYYLSSPLNFLIMFFDSSQLPNCILLIILIKIGLAGLNMNLYLNSKGNNIKINLLFSLCYALMGYAVNYYFNIMWLDVIYMLPLVILGLDKLIIEQKPLLYIITLAYTIICNYYIGYMLCIFVLLYFIYQMMIQNKKNKKTIINFIISSILSAGIASFILIPTIIQIPSFASTQGDLSIKISYIVEIFKGILKNMLIGGHNCSNTSNPYGTYLYITNFCTILTILYILNKSVSKKEKVAFSVICLIFILSFFLLPLTYIWHGFSIPSYLNNRHSFLLCFFFVLLAHKLYYSVEQISIKETLITLFLSLFISIIQILIFGISIINNIIITIFFVMIYLYLIYIQKKYNNKFFEFLIIIFVLIELFINLYISFVSKTIISYSYEDYVNNVCTVVSSAGNSYRTENTINKNGIDGLTCSYNSITAFLSTITENDINFFEQYGYLGEGKVQYNSGLNTIFMDSILGIKYYYNNIGKDILKKDDSTCKNIGLYDEELDNIKEEEFCLYENPYALSIGYKVNSIYAKTSKNVFENQNNLFTAITNNDKKILSEIEYIKNNNEYIIRNDKKNIYIYIDAENINRENKIEIYVNDKKTIGKDPTFLVNNILSIESGTDITKLKIIADDIEKINNIEIYIMDDESVSNELTNLNEQKFTIENINKDTIIGNIKVKEDGYVLFTIPYDKNIKVYANGRYISKKKAFDYFMAIELEKGNYEIIIEYDKKIYYISIIISTIAILFTILFVKKCKKYKKNIKNT